MTPAPESDKEMHSVARAVRFGFAAIVLGLSYPNIHCASRIHAVEEVFRDMLGNKPLPALLAFASHAQPFLFGLSIAIPILAVAVIFVTKLARSIYISGCLVLLAFIEMFFLLSVISESWFAVIRGMTAGSP